jgi:hypothetical protein
MNKAIPELSITDPLLATELNRRWSLRSKVNAIHIGRLDRIEALPGFSGIHGIGTHMSSTRGSMPHSLPVPVDPVVAEVLAGELERMVIQEEDEALGEIQSITDFVTTI